MKTIKPTSEQLDIISMSLRNASILEDEFLYHNKKSTSRRTLVIDRLLGKVARARKYTDPISLTPAQNKLLGDIIVDDATRTSDEMQRNHINTSTPELEYYEKLLKLFATSKGATK